MAASLKSWMNTPISGLMSLISRNSTENMDKESIERLTEGGEGKLPNHVAVIMDGNRRWAKIRGLPTEFGHRAGGQRMKDLTQFCVELGIKVLTIFAFSTENWTRHKVEIDFLMILFEEVVISERERAMRLGIKMSVIGDITKFPECLRKQLNEAMEVTKDNSKLHLIIALNYGGQQDMIQACKAIACQVKDGLISPDNIDGNLIEKELNTKCCEFPNPDMLIRTSGEIRVSNFMLWQLAYTELHFTDVLFPDFGKANFMEALISFQKRQRRFGGHEYLCPSK